MYDVITVGSSLVDIFVHSRFFSLKPSRKGVLLCQRYGQKLEVDSFRVLTGGGGSNTAVGFSRLGFRTGVISELGQDVFAKLVIDEFHAEKVFTNLVIEEKKEATGGSVILVDDQGGRTVMVHRGAASMLDPHDIREGPVRRAGWIHLSSINGRLATLNKLFYLRKEAGNLSFNPGRRELELLRNHQLDLGLWPVTVFLVNQKEWLQLGSMAKLILKQTPVVVITNGGQTGAVITQKEGAFNFRPSKVRSIDDTGAGDAFAVGFLTEYIKRKPITTAIKFGVKNAQSVIKYFGAKKGLIRRYD